MIRRMRPRRESRRRRVGVSGQNTDHLRAQYAGVLCACAWRAPGLRPLSERVLFVSTGALVSAWLISATERYVDRDRTGFAWKDFALNMAGSVAVLVIPRVDDTVALRFRRRQRERTCVNSCMRYPDVRVRPAPTVKIGSLFAFLDRARSGS